MIPDGSVGTAYSAWRTKAIRSELNVNRRHDGTFMKTALNSGEKFAVKHVFDLWKRLINFFPLRGSEWRTNGYALKSFLFAVGLQIYVHVGEKLWKLTIHFRRALLSRSQTSTTFKKRSTWFYV